MRRSICCDRCNGEGIVTTHEPKDPPKVMTHTVCQECNGLGWYEYAKGLLLLLIPNVLLFGGVM